MEMHIRRYIPFLSLLILLIIVSCNDPLSENVYSELTSGTYLNTEDGINAALNGAYDQFYNRQQAQRREFIDVFEAGYGYNVGGSWDSRFAQIHEDFLWSTTDEIVGFNWENFYLIIREANIVLDNLENGEFDEAFKKDIRPEALAFRGYAYSQLYSYYGPTPIFNSANTDTVEKPRASEENMLTQIENDLTAASSNLPIEQEEFGRITKGGALAILTKHYLNTKQWQKTINTADQIIDLGVYNLLSDYDDIFAYDNEQNSELILTIPSDPNNGANGTFMCVSIPPDYPLEPNQSTCTARLYAYDQFMDSFKENDVRDDHIVLQYVNTNGNTIQGYGNDMSLMMFKIGPDPNANGNANGRDIILIRYADILLAKAEALNEVKGPNPESIRLINKIKERAGLDPVELGELQTKEKLRNQIFQQRKHEFYMEGKSREDLIRQGVYVPRAQQRGLNAQDYHRLYPIPQSEMDSNTKIEQNPGY